MSATMTMQVPAHIQARVAARAGQKSAVLSALLTDTFQYPKISTRASRYRLVEDGVETVVGTTLDVVIVGSNPGVSKIWYSKPYDGADAVRPDCYSNDGVAPDPSVEKPFHANCAGCPNNVLGSKLTPNGAKSKVCADQRHLAVVPAADPTKVYSLTVSVSAMKALREYMKSLSNYGLIPEEVVTELGFDDQASFPKVTFAQKGYVPEKAIKAVEDICASDEVLVATRQEVGPMRLAAPKPAAAAIAAPVAEAPKEAPKPAPKAAPKPAPVAEPVATARDEEAPADPLSAMEAKMASLFSDD